MLKIICSICVTADPDFIQRSVILRGFIILWNTQITTAVVVLRSNQVQKLYRHLSNVFCYWSQILASLCIYIQDTAIWHVALQHYFIISNVPQSYEPSATNSFWWIVELFCYRVDMILVKCQEPQPPAWTVNVLFRSLGNIKKYI